MEFNCIAKWAGIVRIIDVKNLHAIIAVVHTVQYLYNEALLFLKIFIQHKNTGLRTHVQI